MPHDHIAGPKGEASDLRRRDVDVAGARAESVVPKESIPVIDDFEDASGDLVTLLLSTRVIELPRQVLVSNRRHGRESR